ncbi:L,D-transpeptidase family protein [Desulfobacterota bacterium M19]
MGIDSSALLNLNVKVLIAARPLSIILVEKDFQRLRVLRYDGRLQVMTEYTAATGENFGPKIVEGDKKTPEGIYFITKKYIDKKLTVFGTKAFHLNYPNIFDRLEKRDGHGIFIHGTNKKLRYDSTNGCISLNNNDLSQLAQFLKVGTIPVIIIPSLLDLKTGQASLPDLSSNNFELARKLLLPEAAEAPITFYNLYMVQVNSQTLVACEYGLPGRKSAFAASYIGFKPGRGWKIMQRLRPPINWIPAVTQKKSHSARRLSTTAAESSFPALSLWLPRKKDIYLNWYREANRPLKLPATSRAPESVHKQKQPTAQKTLPAPYSAPASSMPELVFIILLLSAVLIILSYIIIRLRDLKNKNLAVKLDNKEIQLYSSTTEQQETLINDVKLLKNNLNALDIFLKETVMNKEEFRTRIDDLETRLADRQAEIEQLITEKAALKLKGMSGLSKQVEELGEMRQELQIAQEKLDESRQDLERLPALEAMLADQQEKYQQLALKYAALKQEGAGESASLEEELTTQREKANALREQLETSLAAQEALQNQLQEQKAKQENEAALLLRSQSLESELENSRQECHRLQEEIALLSREETIDNEQEREISRLSSQLEDMRQENNQLNEQIMTLTEQKAELDIARKERQEIAAMQQELTDMRQGISTLREKLQASRDEEHSLRQEIATISSHATRVKELEELLLARQIEITGQKNKIGEIRTEHQQELSGLNRQLEELRQTLEDERARRAEDEVKLHELEEELTARRQTVEQVPVVPAEAEETPGSAAGKETEPADQPATAAKPPTETKTPGSQLLPDDILNKWLGA